jgi:hypothetical protein
MNTKNTVNRTAAVRIAENFRNAALQTLHRKMVGEFPARVAGKSQRATQAAAKRLCIEVMSEIKKHHCAAIVALRKEKIHA